MSLPQGISTHVRAYLTSPDVNLETVSAKQIRKHLSTIFRDLDIKALRSEIDEISIPIFHQVREESESTDRANQAPQQQQQHQSNQSASSLPPLALPSRGIPGVIKAIAPTSEEDSKVINKSKSPSQLTANATSNSQKSNNSNGNSKSNTNSKVKKRKSAAYVNSDDESDGAGGGGKNGDKKKKKKVTRKPRASNGEGGDGTNSNKGIHQELNCSGPLSELIGVATCSRPQVVKKLWEYIKSKGLQDPQDKRQIVCDEALKKVFKQNSVHMFTMNKLLGDHLSKDEEVIQTS
ncbi:hypothetical protein BY996DRAFT_6430405 [Phakopsora pachyrhizi]|uniref:DM2 domain-containing protein n=1 Tax=Phakopsora pachyrhizi TaxID=170000 RepID=A0AAV0AXX4_PHAPC|nr:hypothetical protein BY996DRAFT_6430405 [Phakopsora pachyrhizi]CAH7672891.1 hypothetical protein PPACK8108_LOCUS7726 [Phakopsora pachyrhizi]